jgi:NitT/TauT family transport system substrate-binding protein
MEKDRRNGAFRLAEGVFAFPASRRCDNSWIGEHAKHEPPVCMTTRRILALAGVTFALASTAALTSCGQKASKSAELNQVEASAPAPVPHTAVEDSANAALLADVVLPRVGPAGTYQPKDNIVDIQISEYAGYAGLIAANGGLEPNENSEFFRKGGFKVRLSMSEVESRSGLNAGEIAALATTVDVLPLYGRDFQVVVPVQIGFSRGADGVVVLRDIRRINDLKGRVLAVARFSESDFFIRFLSQEAGIGIHALRGIKERPDPDCVNLVFARDAFSAGDLFLKDTLNETSMLAGCVTWAPKTTELASQLANQAHILVTSLNLLIVADVLVVNRGFARNHPDMVTALVAGILEGNRKVQNDGDSYLDIIGGAFGWDRETTKNELTKVHLANLPENLAFFGGWLDAGGSFEDLYDAALVAYGGKRSKDKSVREQFFDVQHLAKVEQSGAFKEQEVSIAPIRRNDSVASTTPLLSKDIRFLFEPNNYILRLEVEGNQDSLRSLDQMLQISPGSTVLLRGHVDDARLGEFRKIGGENYVKLMAEKAQELSKNRALEIRRLLVERYDIDPARIDTVGLGWSEPAGTDKEQNRRVEALWFTVK